MKALSLVALLAIACPAPLAAQTAAEVLASAERVRDQAKVIAMTKLEAELSAGMGLVRIDTWIEAFRKKCTDDICRLTFTVHQAHLWWIGASVAIDLTARKEVDIVASAKKVEERIHLVEESKKLHFPEK